MNTITVNTVEGLKKILDNESNAIQEATFIIGESPSKPETHFKVEVQGFETSDWVGNALCDAEE